MQMTCLAGQETRRLLVTCCPSPVSGVTPPLYAANTAAGDMGAGHSQRENKDRQLVEQDPAGHQVRQLRCNSEWKIEL